eukprot:366209-Chlamydomonas_euryale.AAC.13
MDVVICICLQGKELWLQHVTAEPGWMPQLLLVVNNVLDTVCLERCLDAMVAVLHVHAQQDSAKDDDVADGVGGQSERPAHVTSQDNTDCELPSGRPANEALQSSGSINLLERQVWMQVLDVVLQMLTNYIEQQVQEKSAEESERSSNGSGSCLGKVGPVQTGIPSAYISSKCVDGALRVLEQVAANRCGRTLLQIDTAPENRAQPEHLDLASDSTATMHHGIQVRQVGETLLSLLSQLLHCTCEVQVRDPEALWSALQSFNARDDGAHMELRSYSLVLPRDTPHHHHVIFNAARLTRLGHVARMPDEPVVKLLLFPELMGLSGMVGRPRSTWRDGASSSAPGSRHVPIGGVGLVWGGSGP